MHKNHLSNLTNIKVSLNFFCKKDCVARGWMSQARVTNHWLASPTSTHYQIIWVSTNWQIGYYCALLPLYRASCLTKFFLRIKHSYQIIFTIPWACPWAHKIVTSFSLRSQLIFKIFGNRRGFLLCLVMCRFHRVQLIVTQPRLFQT